MALPAEWLTRLRLPLIAAPMLHVSGPALVAAACRSGVIGAFPAANCRQHGELSVWIASIREAIDGANAAPFAVNLIVRSATLVDELAAEYDAARLSSHRLAPAGAFTISRMTP